MSELNVVAVIAAKPGSESIVAEALTSLVEPTRAEDGCLSYDLFVSTVAPGTFITIEKWRSQADLDAHMGTSHIKAALDIAGAHLANAPAIHPLAPVSA